MPCAYFIKGMPYFSINDIQPSGASRPVHYFVFRFINTSVISSSGSRLRDNVKNSSHNDVHYRTIFFADMPPACMNISSFQPTVFRSFSTGNACLAPGGKNKGFRKTSPWYFSRLLCILKKLNKENLRPAPVPLSRPTARWFSFSVSDIQVDHLWQHTVSFRTIKNTALKTNIYLSQTMPRILCSNSIFIILHYVLYRNCRILTSCICWADSIFSRFLIPAYRFYLSVHSNNVANGSGQYSCQYHYNSAATSIKSL